MIKEAVATGASIEEAQQAATLKLDAPINADVQFEVITMPEKKVLGLFGGKQAEVRAYYEAPDEVKPKNNKPENKKTEKKQAPRDNRNDSDSRKKTQQSEKAPAVVVPKEPVELEKCPATVKKAYAYLNTVISGIGVTGAVVEIFKSDKEYFFEISSEEDYSILIGRRGETLDSIQYLVRLVANREKNDDDFSKVSINIGNYRQKRETTLKDIANRTAMKVKKYGRSIALDPMNPFERRIIHTEISSIDDVVSYSVGTDAERKVVIALADGAKPTNSRRPSYSGGYNNNNRGRGGRPDRAPRENNTVVAPTRAPRSDAQGLSRYGKISPKED